MPLTKRQPEVLPATIGVNLERTGMSNRMAFSPPFWALLVKISNDECLTSLYTMSQMEEETLLPIISNITYNWLIQVQK